MFQVVPVLPRPASASGCDWSRTQRRPGSYLVIHEGTPSVLHPNTRMLSSGNDVATSHMVASADIITMCKATGDCA